MRKNCLFISIGFLALIVFLVINLTYLNVYFPHVRHLRYMSEDDQWETIERGKGRDPFGSVVLSFEEYKKDTNGKDLKMHRCFTRDWFQVWNWIDFTFHPRWKVPYKPCPDTDFYRMLRDRDAKVREVSRRLKDKGEMDYDTWRAEGQKVLDSLHIEDSLKAQK